MNPLRVAIALGVGTLAGYCAASATGCTPATTQALLRDALPMVASEVTRVCDADREDVLRRREARELTQAQAEAAFADVALRCDGAEALLRRLEVGDGAAR